jgi:putative hydrolase of the HAD superfamily
LTSALTFDAMGTLLYMEPPAPHLRAELLRVTGVDVTEERAASAFASEIGYYLQHHLEGGDPASLSVLRDRCAAVLRDALELPDVELAQAREVLLGSIRFHAFADAAPALEELRSLGLRLVVASNWDSSLPEVLERAGLGPLFDGVVSSAMVGSTKPAPEVFREALRLAGAEPGDALHVGDSLENDIEGARALRIRAVLIERDGAPPVSGVETIGALTELPRLLSAQ